MKSKSIFLITPFVLLVLTLSTTFYTGNMIRLFLYCFSVILIYPISRLFDTNAFLISVYSVLYGVFAYLSGNILSLSGLLYIIVPGVIFYLFGKFVGLCNYDKRERMIWFYLIIIISFAITIYYNLFLNIHNIGSIVNTDRVLESSSQDLIASATMIGLYVSLGLCYLPVFIFDSGWKLRRWISLLIFTLSILSIVFLVNRTGILITIAIIVIASLYMNKTSSYSIITKLILIPLIILIFYCIFGDQWSAIVTAYADRNVDLSTGGERFYRWWEALGYLFTNPFGWSNKANYAHNMWLDVARVSGVLPFVLLLMITYKYYKALKQFCNVSSDKFLNMIHISIFTCFMCTCLVEPVVQGEIMYLNLIFMSFGILVGLYKSNLCESKLRISGVKRSI